MHDINFMVYLSTMNFNNMEKLYTKWYFAFQGNSYHNALKLINKNQNKLYILLNNKNIIRYCHKCNLFCLWAFEKSKCHA